MTLSVLMVMYPGCVALDVVGPHEVFALAGALTAARDGTPTYALQRVALTPGPIPTASGLVLHAEHALDDAWPAHTLFVPGMIDRLGDRCDPALLRWLERHHMACPRLAGVCTGAFYLAAAGALDGRRATTHWQSAARLAELHPAIEVDAEAIFVRSGNVWTSAGVTAGIDLALAMVEQDCGLDIAQAVARELVVFLRRPGGQSQFSSHLQAPLTDDDRLARVQNWIADHLDDDLRVDALAHRAAMSPRHFARVFRDQLQCTPAHYVERCRVEAVRNQLEGSQLSLSTLATRTGFKSVEVMRRAFRRHFGVSPQVYRARFSLP
ncbi:MAG: GlxA family transcriptional regulator [Bradymonadia bacterium]